MSKDVKDVAVVTEHWSDSLRTEIQTLVGVNNVVKEVTTAKDRKASVSTRTKLAKLIKGIDTARKASNKAVQDENKAIAEELEGIVVPLKDDYDKAIEAYDKKLEEEQAAKVAEAEREAKELLDGRLEQLDGLITEAELEFTPIETMSDEQFAKFVAYRKSIKIVPVAKVEADEPFDTMEEALDDAEMQQETTTEVEPVEIKLEVLTDDDEIGQFYKYQMMFNKCKKPAVISSPTALAVREMMDNLGEALDAIIPDDE